MTQSIFNKKYRNKITLMNSYAYELIIIMEKNFNKWKLIFILWKICLLLEHENKTVYDNFTSMR